MGSINKLTVRGLMAALGLVVHLATTALQAADPVAISIDPAAGVIDGKAAAGYWVSEVETPDVLLDPAGFEVVMSPKGDPRTVLRFPCGEWFLPPLGRYRVMIEGPGWMTPFPWAASYSTQLFAKRGRAAVMPVVPAGTVIVRDEDEPNRRLELRLLHLNSHLLFPEGYKHELVRRVPAEQARQGVRMPRGQVVVAWVDPATDKDVMISRPIEVQPGKIITVVGQPPAAGTMDVIAVLQRPKMMLDRSSDDLRAVWKSPDGDLRQPDAFVPSLSRGFAIWWGVQGEGTVEVTSSHYRSVRQDLPLAPGQVRRLHLMLAASQPP